MQEDHKQPGANSRRDFLKNSALAAAGFMIVPRHVLGGKGFIAPSDRLQIAGIGVGGKGQSDIAEFSNKGLAPVDIAFLCDVDDRRSATTRANFPKAKYYKDFREMLEKEHKHIDAVSVSTPDHQHAVAAMAAMQLGKHVYVQKPLTHDIYEARALTAAAKKYKVVTQMGNQGSSGDGVRQLMEWYNAGLVGDVHTVYCWTDRPVWPQGIPWSANKAEVPKELNWDLWLGTAPYKDFVDKLVPFNWRGWWDYGTGALGDMGCHIIEPPFRVLGLEYPSEVECSVGSVYVDEFKRGYFPDSCPPSSHVTLRFKKPDGKTVTLHWMDGGIQPERPEELGPNETMGDGGNGALFIGTKGKMMCGTYGINPQLLPTSKTATAGVAQTIARVPEGHYQQWVNGAIAGYGKKQLSSPFEIAGPLTETLLMANLAIRSFDIRVSKPENPAQFSYPGRYIKLLWDQQAMKVTNFDAANQFVKRQYREGWSLGV
ncbi:Tat (twin-arginine translocation) pathway signal sequence [Chitinophaga costaii]|uniref:Tat (Twin-arginine translocation) pathway signal sequence n=1 Tax=Chitinophaga costaii TaxID=1335309 RepID=A0A1C4AD87_9BACT|nr:Gfo/Idh/MocA family oxidoreductase [Chitinophaga costaii]PUZ26562.1 gfo/Idh/MocA family oxidoreductase [Chitinophaga costaii]SCB92569.1 Tat (twin-arginine translocation) pathway signal sequence [Chitinophaga costaii]